MMASMGAKMPRMKKTGTTIVGLTFKVPCRRRRAPRLVVAQAVSAGCVCY